MYLIVINTRTNNDLRIRTAQANVRAPIPSAGNQDPQAASPLVVGHNFRGSFPLERLHKRIDMPQNSDGFRKPSAREQAGGLDNLDELHQLVEAFRISNSPHQTACPVVE